jgi:hypothetical protein
MRLTGSGFEGCHECVLVASYARLAIVSFCVSGACEVWARFGAK